MCVQGHPRLFTHSILRHSKSREQLKYPPPGEQIPVGTPALGECQAAISKPEGTSADSRRFTSANQSREQSTVHTVTYVLKQTSTHIFYVFTHACAGYLCKGPRHLGRPLPLERGTGSPGGRREELHTCLLLGTMKPQLPPRHRASPLHHPPPGPAWQGWCPFLQLFLSASLPSCLADRNPQADLP